MKNKSLKKQLLEEVAKLKSLEEGIPQKEGFIQNQYKNAVNTIKSVGKTAKRETTETIQAARIIANIIKNRNANPEEVQFLKTQSVDILKILGILGISVVSSAIPVLLDKILKPKGINIFPQENNPTSNPNQK
jgi:hypothetical protein